MSRFINSSLPALALLFILLTQASADTSFNGGDIFTAGDWTHGLPSLGNNGTIAVGGTFTSSQVSPVAPFNFNQMGPGTVTVNQTAGALTTGGGDNDFYPDNSATLPVTFDWNQSGGSVTTRLLVPGNGFEYTLSGIGEIDAKHTGGDRIYLYSGTTGTFAQTGGTLNGIAIDVENGSTLRLSGGTATNIGSDFNQAITGAAGSTVSVSGNYSMTFNSSITSANLIVLSGSADVDFNPAWTGSWTHAGFTTADWISALTDTGVMVGATQVTAGNFNSLFVVHDSGLADSSISLVVPEPSSLVLMASAAVAFASIYRRRRRSV